MKYFFTFLTRLPFCINGIKNFLFSGDVKLKPREKGSKGVSGTRAHAKRASLTSASTSQVKIENWLFCFVLFNNINLLLVKECLSIVPHSEILQEIIGLSLKLMTFDIKHVPSESMHVPPT